MIVRDLGSRGIALWRETYPGTVANGTLVVALQRDRAELDRFARMTEGHQRLSPAELAAAEPALVDRFAGALFYAEEAHLSPEPALRFLLERRKPQGVASVSATARCPQDADLVIDCRGLAAKDDLPNSARRARRADRGQEPRGELCRGPCGSCIRAFPSTSCPGARAFT